MLGVFAYDHDLAFSFDDLAFFADLFNRRLNFHLDTSNKYRLF